MSDSINLAKLMESIKEGGNELNDEFEVEKDDTIKKGSGYNKPENDECKEEDEESSFSQKNKQRKLNTNMSNKSVFDSLYKKVLKENFGPEQDDDIDALGLDDATPDSEMDDEFGGEDEGDSVTLTLDRATAQSLIEVLQGALGEDEGEGDDFGDDDLEGEDGLDFGDEDEDNEDEDEDEDPSFDEDEETQGTKPAKDKKAAYQGAKKSPQVKSALKPKGKKKASTKLTDGTETGTNAKETYNDGKQNKVKGFPSGPDFFK